MFCQNPFSTAFKAQTAALAAELQRQDGRRERFEFQTAWGCDSAICVPEVIGDLLLMDQKSQGQPPGDVFETPVNVKEYLLYHNL